MDRIFQKWIVNAKCGSYFPKVARKCGKWIVFLIWATGGGTSTYFPS
ncbi:hypothetical protein AAEO50_02790 [Rossellomorea oryzaecorticis]|uniref:Uncharacterized protein n=1 Tax=Rossellomorea oryzaecorticis TaxID=1396505 RepID=A0ABU9K7I6_9BACI